MLCVSAELGSWLSREHPCPLYPSLTFSHLLLHLTYTLLPCYTPSTPHNSLFLTLLYSPSYPFLLSSPSHSHMNSSDLFHPPYFSHPFHIIYHFMPLHPNTPLYSCTSFQNTTDSLYPLTSLHHSNIFIGHSPLLSSHLLILHSPHIPPGSLRPITPTHHIHIFAPFTYICPLRLLLSLMYTNHPFKLSFLYLLFLFLIVYSIIVVSVFSLLLSSTQPTPLAHSQSPLHCPLSVVCAHESFTLVL